MTKYSGVFIFLFLSVVACLAEGGDAKNNELGLTIGAESTLEQGFHFGSPVTRQVVARPANSVVFGFNYARRIHTGPKATLFLEFPVFAGPSHRPSYRVTPPPGFPTPFPTSLATLYFTPAVRVNFKPDARFSPWLSFGGGYAFYEGSERLSTGIPNPDRNTHTGALQFGGGLDIRTPIKVLVPVHLRTEIRDFHTFDSVNYNLGRGGSQDNLVFAGGIVLKF